MNVLKYRVSLDMFDTLSQTTIKAKKGDSACQIHITLTDHGKIYEISEGCKAKLYIKKADGNPIYDNCTIENNTIVYDFRTSIKEDVCQVSTCEGNAECEVTLENANGEQLTSPRFTLYIDGTIYDGEEIESLPETDVLKTLINDANNLIDEVETKLNNGEFNGEKGDKGDAGVVEFIIVNELPTDDIKNAIYLMPSVTPGEKNVFLEYVYIDGAWEMIGSTAVEVNLDDYVKVTDYATNTKGGVVKVSNHTSGLLVSNGSLLISAASSDDIYAKNDNYKPLTSRTVDSVVKNGIISNVFDLTEQEQAGACEWLGAYSKVKTIKFSNGDTLIVKDNTEYIAETDISNITVVYPNTNFMCSLYFKLASEGDITITLPESKYIGGKPLFANGQTWELNIKNGVVVGGIAE